MKTAPSWGPGLCAECQKVRGKQSVAAPPFRGWLLLFSISLLIAPALVLRDAIAFGAASDREPVFAIIALLYGGRFVAWIVTGVFFALRRRLAVWMVRALLVVAIAATVLEAVFFGVGDDVFRDFLRPIVFNVSWLAYFCLSEQVKETFTR